MCISLLQTRDSDIKMLLGASAPEPYAWMNFAKGSNATVALEMGSGHVYGAQCS